MNETCRRIQKRRRKALAAVLFTDSTRASKSKALLLQLFLGQGTAGSVYPTLAAMPLIDAG